MRERGRASRTRGERLAMDPNANLAEQEELLQEIAEYGANTHHPGCVNATDDLLVLRLQLGEWIDTGGFSPDWSKAPNAARWYGRQ